VVRVTVFYRVREYNVFYRVREYNGLIVTNCVGECMWEQGAINESTVVLVLVFNRVREYDGAE